MKLLNVIKDIKQGQLPSFTYMFKRIWSYAKQYSKEYGVSKLHLFLDYFWCAFVYGCSGNDYFLYKFFLLKRRGKKKLVTEMYEVKFEKAHTDGELEKLIGDKEKSLNYFTDYMKRDWCAPSYRNTAEDFDDFYKNHDRGIIKPLCGLGGRGIEIVKIKEKFVNGGGAA